jgi:hypothetical protein
MTVNLCTAYKQNISYISSFCPCSKEKRNLITTVWHVIIYTESRVTVTRVSVLSPGLLFVSEYVDEPGMC